MKDLEEIKKDIWSTEDVEERKEKIVQYILESLKEPRDFEEEDSGIAERWETAPDGHTERSESEEGKKILGFLQDNVTDCMKLPELVDVFEKMTEISVGDWEDWEDMTLFEAGTYPFTGRPMFTVSLVRQFPNDEDEFYQLHLNALFLPEEKTGRISFSEWSESVDGDFFAFVRETDIYTMMKDEVPAEVNIYLDET